MRIDSDSNYLGVPLPEQQENGVETEPCGLARAHSGYMYQDLVTAYFLARALIDSYSVGVDKKNFSGDIFDDIGLGGSRRIQLKSSLNSSLALALEDLSTTRRNTRIDQLLYSAKEDGFSAQEYRLCATWTRSTDPRLTGVLEPENSDSSFTGYGTTLYRLRPSALVGDSPGPLGKLLSSYSSSEIESFCSRFRLELECPMASLDLASPGPLETLLLDILSLGIGVGQFPNQDLQVVDTAANLINFATLARSGQRTVSPNDTILRLRLRTDFGRIAQKFPINKTVLIEQEAILDALAQRVGENPVTLVTGEPGAGKSWLLTQLTDRWRRSGVAAVRHYCYLEPTDRDVQRRVTSRLMFGNLTAELLDVRPELRSGASPLYAATAESFERLLGDSQEDDLIFLVVDGIDHISRVFHQSKGLAAEDIDIVEQLSLLSLPSNVHLIVGSQPGPHLAPLASGDNVFQMPSWSSGDIESLINKASLAAILVDSGHADQLPGVVSEIAKRAEGNPLYATFIIRELLSRISAGYAVDVVGFLGDIPLRNGDLRNYYEYLFQRISEHQSVSFAETLALLDFGVSRVDLAELFPADAHRLAAALALLEPILERLPTQGGFRIYHESFRRFVTDNLLVQGASIEDRLEPVCSWLERRGFLKDSRSYRFLLPTLRRAGKNIDLLAKVTPTFMTDSLAEGQSPTAISYNLVVAAETAARELDWPALVRINELQRANATYVSERLGDVAMYGMAFGELRGVAALNERLLFEGRPTFDVEPGLLLCEICDRGGVVPPWREYFRLPPSTESSPISEFDFALAEFRGIARLEGEQEAMDILIDWAVRFPQRSGLLYGAVHRLRSIFGEPIFDLLKSRTLPDSLRQVLAFQELRLAKRSGDQQRATVIGNEIVSATSDLTIIADAVRLGASTENLPPYPALDSFNLSDPRFSRDGKAVTEWLACLSIVARTDKAQIAAERLRVAGEGWYHYWLLFAIAIAEAGEMADHDRNASKQVATEAFDLLIQDTRPFVGNPRACDLFSIQSEIFDSIKAGLDLLDEDPNAFKVVLPKLVRVSNETTTLLQNNEGGPLDTEALFNVLRDFVEIPALEHLILPVLQDQCAQRSSNSGVYTAIVVQELQLCYIYARLSKMAEAEAHWARACKYLAAYGQRKDITLGELLEGQLAIGRIAGESAADLVERSQPLIYEVVAHTDSKGTKRFPVDWFESLCQVRPAQAAVLLARAFARNCGVVDWRLEESLEALLLSMEAHGDPLTLDALWSTLLPDNPSATISSRMAVLDRICQQCSDLGMKLYVRFASEVQGDTHSLSNADIDRVRTRIEELGGALPGDRSTFATDNPGERRTGRSFSSRDRKEISQPWFSSVASPLELLAQVRKVRFRDDEQLEGFVNALGYRLLSILESGYAEQVEVLLKQIAKDSISEGKAGIVYSGLAAGFERIGQFRLAALCFGLAFTRSRGAGGWLVFGDEKHVPLFREAIRLAPEVAYGLLAEEMLARIDGESYVAGLSQNLVTLFCGLGNPGMARSIWLAACEVIESRFPRAFDTFHPFERFEAGDADSVSLKTSLTWLLLSRIVHPDLRRKRSALAGAAFLLKRDTDSFATAASQFLGALGSFTSLLALLVLIIRFESHPYMVTKALAQQLEPLAVGDSFGVCQIARMLLDRAEVATQFGARERVPLERGPLSDNKEEAILAWDHSERVDNLSMFWPDYPHLLAVYFDHLWQSDPENLETEKRRLALIQDPAGQKLPAPPVLHWHDELFEIALHRTLNHLDVESWRQGRPDTSFLNEVARRVSPNVEMYVRWWASRVVRPDIPLPSQQNGDDQLLGSLPETDDYAGWVRVALYETEHQLSEGSVHADVQSTVRVAAGMVIPRLGVTSSPSNSLPFGIGDFENWNDTQSDAPLFRDGPVVGMDYLSDYLGILPLLMLQRRLTAHLGVVPSETLGPLQLDDISRYPAVIFRQWHLHPLGDRLSRSADRNVGCDLVVRPDVWEAIQALYPSQMVLPQISRKTEAFGSEMV